MVRHGRQRQRRDVIDHLTRHPQGLAAAGQEAQRRAGLEQGLRQVCAGRDQVLAVVQHQQQGLFPHVVAQGGCHRLSRRLAHAEPLGDGLRHQLGVGQARQFYQPDAVGKAVQHSPRRLER
jgi:hypothetical protein